MSLPNMDPRSPERRLRDEQIAAEPEMPAPEIPHDATPSPMESHTSGDLIVNRGPLQDSLKMA